MPNNVQVYAQMAGHAAAQITCGKEFIMENFTFDELNLMCFYDTGTRQGLIDALTEMRGYLEADETELLALTDSALEKLRRMTDAEYAELDLFPDFNTV